MLGRKHTRAGGEWWVGVGDGISSFSTSSEPCWSLARNQLQEATWDQRWTKGTRGPKMPPRAQSLSLKQNLEPGSLDCAPEIQGLGAGLGLLLWAVTPSFLGLGCRVIISLNNDKGDAHSGKVTQRHIASQGQSLQKRTELFCHAECLCGEYSTQSW